MVVVHDSCSPADTRIRKHVLKDLRPYLCTSEHCFRAATPFPSLKSYLEHESHSCGPHAARSESRSPAVLNRSPNDDRTFCVFCREHIKAGKGNKSWGRYVGQHLEEIAFIVVPKMYEEWNFYSDSSLANSISADTTAFAVPRMYGGNMSSTFKCAFDGCTAGPFQTLYLLK